MGIVDYMAHPDNLGAIRSLETLNPSYKLVQQEMGVRRRQQCADLLNGQRNLGTNSKVPQDAIDCICDKTGENIPYYVCNTRYHAVLVPTVIDYVGNNTGPASGTATSGRRRLLHDDEHNPMDMSRPPIWMTSV
ncbi:hypothetical protein WJX72_010674 [[Myrmecia] bisecta]|uniref:Uncharacterized protein n=1 Tax=[Myrmecia] bisecta TaxID=41462 RepID=A0AAW1P5H0_9CHLO